MNYVCTELHLTFATFMEFFWRCSISYQRARQWRPSAGKRFFLLRIRPDRPWCPPSLLYNGYRGTFPGIKAAGAWRWSPIPSSAEVKERVELYPTPPFCLRGNVVVRILPYTRGVGNRSPYFFSTR